MIKQRAQLQADTRTQQCELLLRYLRGEATDEAREACLEWKEHVAKVKVEPLIFGDQATTELESLHDELISAYQYHVGQQTMAFEAELQAIRTSHDRQLAALTQQIDDPDATVSQQKDEHNTTKLLPKEAHSAPPAEASSKPPYNLTTLSNASPTIIFYNGKWHAIACCFCGANVISNSPHKFFGGWRGLTQHISMMHNDRGFAEVTLVEQCRKETFDDEDVELMRGGSQPRAAGIVQVPGNGVRRVVMVSEKPFVWKEVEG